MIRALRNAGYALYAGHLRRRLAVAELPRHVAVVMDGNRRWAGQAGLDRPGDGHRHGAQRLEALLGWCAALGITHVTVFVASADNLRKRSADEVALLLDLIEEVSGEWLARPAGAWRLHVAGRLDLLPDSTRNALKLAVDATARQGADAHLTVAVGYDGREEVVDAVRSLLDSAAGSGETLADVAGRLTPADIAAHLYTSGQPDPDLVIRTSGELRLSGFLLWQAAYAELYFCDVYWPGLREVDFLRALRVYAQRHRRFGR